MGWPRVPRGSRSARSVALVRRVRVAFSPVASSGRMGMGRGRRRAAHHDPDSDRPRVQGRVVRGRARVHGHIAGRDAVPTASRGGVGGRGAPGGGWVGDGARRGTPAPWGSPTIRVHPMGADLRALESRSTEGSPVEGVECVRGREKGPCGARVARRRPL